jgi:hypothetical protein
MIFVVLIRGRRESRLVGAAAVTLAVISDEAMPATFVATAASMSGIAPPYDMAASHLFASSPLLSCRRTQI